MIGCPIYILLAAFGKTLSLALQEQHSRDVVEHLRNIKETNIIITELRNTTFLVWQRLLIFFLFAINLAPLKFSSLDHLPALETAVRPSHHVDLPFFLSFFFLVPSFFSFFLSFFLLFPFSFPLFLSLSLPPLFPFPFFTFLYFWRPFVTGGWP